MRTRITTALGLAALVVTTAACSSGSSAPAPVRNYGPEAGIASTPAPQPYTGEGWVEQAAPQPAPSRAPVSRGPVRWHYRLADAQAEARSTGRMILVMSTKPRCGLCEKFKTQIAPATAGELSRVAVGYVYDITRPEVRDVDRLLRANLRGADLMPLVGFITPEMGWVHGFWGQRSVGQFRSDIATASARHPVSGARVVSPTMRDRPAMAMVTNEYGEQEWAHRADVWPAGDPEPIDALTGAPEAQPSMVVTTRPGTVLADATPPSPTTPAAPAPRYEVPAAAGSGMPARPAPPALPVIDATTAPRVASTQPAAPGPASAPAPAAATPTPDAPEATDDQTWARAELQRALRQIRAGEFDSARSTLAVVRDRLPETDLAREASKGAIALYNMKRIRFATSGAERSRYLSRARRDFNNSMWAPLFNS